MPPKIPPLFPVKKAALAVNWFKAGLCGINPPAENEPPLFFNFQGLRSYPLLRSATAILLGQMMGKNLPDLIAEVPSCLSTTVGLISDGYNLPMITPRLDKTVNGRPHIDGIFQPGQRVILFDDKVTRADYKLDCIRLLERAGLKVQKVIVLLDRERGGMVELKRRGYRPKAAFTISQLLRLYKRRGLITPEQHENIRAQIFSRQVLSVGA